MAIFGSKHFHEDLLVFADLTGGVNYSMPPDLIADNELSGALNFFYDPNTYRLTNRPGVSRYSATGEASGNPIVGGFYSSILDIDFVVSDGELYKLDSSFEFEDIDALTGSSVKPSFIDFNGKVLIASGGNIQFTDGTTLSTIATSPDSEKIMTYAGRVVTAGDSTYPHRLTLSGPGDETDWDTSTGDAKYFDVAIGIGDGIVDFNVIGNDIVIFKGTQDKGIYRLIVPNMDFDNAYIVEGSKANTSVGWGCSVQIADDLMFLDGNGVKSLVTTQKYGDIEQDDTGRKINSVIAGTIDGSVAFVVRNPAYSQIWIKYAGTEVIYVYNWLLKAFLPIKFQGLTMHSAWYHEDTGTFLIGMSDGFVYQLDDTTYTDNDLPVAAYFYTKRFKALANLKTLGALYRKLHKQSIVDYESIDTGIATFQLEVDSGDNTITLANFQLTSGFDLLMNAVTLLNVATQSLYGQNYKTKRISKLVNFYDGRFVLFITSGGIKLNRIESRIAISGRR